MTLAVKGNTHMNTYIYIYMYIVYSYKLNAYINLFIFLLSAMLPYIVYGHIQLQ